MVSVRDLANGANTPDSRSVYSEISIKCGFLESPSYVGRYIEERTNRKA